MSKSKLGSKNFYSKLAELLSQKTIKGTHHVSKSMKETILRECYGTIPKGKIFVPFVSERDKMGRLLSDPIKNHDELTHRPTKPRYQYHKTQSLYYAPPSTNYPSQRVFLIS